MGFKTNLFSLCTLRSLHIITQCSSLSLSRNHRRSQCKHQEKSLSLVLLSGLMWCSLKYDLRICLGVNKLNNKWKVIDETGLVILVIQVHFSSIFCSKRSFWKEAFRSVALKNTSRWTGLSSENAWLKEIIRKGRKGRKSEVKTFFHVSCCPNLFFILCFLLFLPTKFFIWLLYF